MFKLILLFTPFSLFAAVSTNNQAEQIIDVFDNASTAWDGVVIPAALFVFWSLVAIDWVLTFGYMAIKGTDFAELFYELIRKVIIIGFFLFLFTTVSLMDVIPLSLGQLANNATGVDIEPDTVLEQAFVIVHAVWDGMGWSIDSIGLFFAGVIILIAFAYMAALLFVSIIKLYLIITGAYLVYSLGGLTQTRSYAINPIIAIIKGSLELFFIKLVLGLTVVTIQNMSANVGTDNSSIMAMIGIAVLLASLVHMIPGLVESLVSGHFSGSSTAGLGTAKAVGAAAVGATVGAVAGGIAGNSAINAAKDLSAAGQGSTLGNLAKAAGSDAINTITGANKYAAGNMGVRMANTMSGMTDVLKSADSLDNAKKAETTSSTSKGVFGGANDLMGAIQSANTGANSNTSSSQNGNSTNSSYVSGVSGDILNSNNEKG